MDDAQTIKKLEDDTQKIDTPQDVTQNDQLKSASTIDTVAQTHEYSQVAPSIIFPENIPPKETPSEQIQIVSQNDVEMEEQIIEDCPMENLEEIQDVDHIDQLHTTEQIEVINAKEGLQDVEQMQSLFAAKQINDIPTVEKIEDNIGVEQTEQVEFNPILDGQQN